jgi:hypothetical protein
LIGAHAEIAMPGGLRDHRAARIDARARQPPFIDRPLQREGRPANIAHRGEAAHKRPFSLLRGNEMHIRNIRRHRRDLADAGKNGVPVRIDETRHQHLAGTVDHVGICHRLILPYKAFDAVFRDQNIAPFDIGRGLAVEYSDILQKHRLSLRSKGRQSNRRSADCRGNAPQHRPSGRATGKPRVDFSNHRAVAQATEAVAQMAVFRSKADAHADLLRLKQCRDDS